MRQKIGIKAAAVVLLFGSFCPAQETAAPPPLVKFYKLEFVVKDLEGSKIVTTRNYSVIVSTDSHAQSDVRAGSRLTFDNSKFTSMSPQLEVGTNIHCFSVKDLQNSVSFSIVVDSSNLLRETPDGPPIIRQNKWASDVIVPLKRPTVVFSSDDSTTKHVLQLEVLATPIPVS